VIYELFVSYQLPEVSDPQQAGVNEEIQKKKKFVFQKQFFYIYLLFKIPVYANPIFTCL